MRWSTATTKLISPQATALIAFFLVRPLCFQEGWRDGSLSLTPRRTERSFGRRPETLAKVFLFFCPGDMDVSRDEKSRSGSISDNHSKPVGGDNENTLTNCPRRAREKTTTTQPPTNPPQEDDHYKRSGGAFYTGAPRHFECWCSDRRDAARAA